MHQLIYGAKLVFFFSKVKNSVMCRSSQYCEAYWICHQQALHHHSWLVPLRIHVVQMNQHASINRMATRSTVSRMSKDTLWYKKKCLGCPAILYQKIATSILSNVCHLLMLGTFMCCQMYTEISLHSYFGILFLDFLDSSNTSIEYEVCYKYRLNLYSC